ncbi:metallophosphoesterase family protein [Paenibacillus harenae]|uniref:metallophosphoesterase family protein n=1 Tax=Paenibacillus harenae TaxID=306543 RepID=UPI0027948D37|nr:DNA repair exonuclease [Paenibacillus harenae]MDQ0059274.1 DNA repair exonuclease SbcCD nuclease subunit [Paenibacillus harenae]
MAVPFRFIHAADLHLDSPFRGLAKAPEALRERLVESTFAAMRQLTDTAIAEKVDFLVLAGDLFDAADRSLRAQLRLAREWERLAEHGIAVFVIHGNHDPLSGARVDLKLPSSVHIFSADQIESKPAYRRDGELAAFVYGISYGSRSVTDNLALRYRAMPGAPFHIAMLHGNVGGDNGHDPYAPCTLDELTGNAGFHYWALGHIHHRKVLHKYPHVVYPGNTQGRNPRETGQKGCYLVDVTAAGAVDLQFMPLDDVRWLEDQVSIAAIQSEHELLQQLESAMTRLGMDLEGRFAMVRLELAGRGPLHRRLSEPQAVAALLEQLQELGEERMTWVYALDNRTASELDWEEIAAEDSFAGELCRLSAKLAAGEESWEAFAKEAVHAMAGHQKLGKLLRSKWEELPEQWLERSREHVLGLIAGEGNGQ